MSASPESWRAELLAALTFLTRLPLHRAALDEPIAADLASAAWAFPLAGVVVGAIGGASYAIARAFGLPALAAALIAVGATALATGGLHEDGLADMVDGLGGGASREEKLAIMRDSRIGVYGVLALIFSVALRVAAIGQIGTTWRVAGALMGAHALARGFLPAAMRFLDPARSDGLGASAGRPAARVVLWAAGIGLAAVLLGVGLRPGFTAAIAAVAAVAAVGWLAERQVGGQTGDILGAIEQGGEIAALLAIAAWSP
ncbi:MAG TPA: adenosylcobinamide-GDP ribazoletransferase [Stellaceae bacterium]|nr:adenosylcobinamide-GDP ribazoletransferase [Stellaceae bacterium]